LYLIISEREYFIKLQDVFLRITFKRSEKNRIKTPDMKRYILLFVFAVTLCCLSLISYSQELTLSQTNKSGIYKKGQKITVKASTENYVDTLHIRVYKNNNQLLLQKDLMTGQDTLIIYEGAFTESCSIIVEARMKRVNASTGMLVDPDKLKPGYKRPGDFENYWKNQKKSLSLLPFDVKRSVVMGTGSDKGYSCEDIEINCTGPKPARGYFAKPEKAAPGSLPIVILVHAAGVKGSWCRSEPGNAINYARMGTLCFDLNAHGMLNDQPEEYYVNLENNEIKTYSLQGLTNRDDVYFRGMYLRLIRTIDFLTKQPEWDGKRILVIGESQGGGQALVAAGLDARVSAVVAIVPAMCDWFGLMAGRMGGWPQPYESNDSKKEMLKALPYFDAANILKDSKAIIYAEIGLIDMTCPSTSVYAAINQVKGQRIIYTVPYRPHHQPEGALAKTWEDTVYKPRELFIKNYLK
jgi:cephalosporin-C deacetylase-like acetyl esterase